MLQEDDKLQAEEIGNGELSVSPIQGLSIRSLTICQPHAQISDHLSALFFSAGSSQGFFDG